MRVKAKSTFSDFATVSAKLSWTELDSPGNVGCRPNVMEFTFPLVQRFPLIILSIQPPKQQAAGSSHITRPRPGNDVMPPDSWVGVSYMMRPTRLNDMLGLSKGHVTYSPSALEGDLYNSFVPKYTLWHCRSHPNPNCPFLGQAIEKLPNDAPNNRATISASLSISMRFPPSSE